MCHCGCDCRLTGDYCDYSWSDCDQCVKQKKLEKMLKDLKLYRESISDIYDTVPHHGIGKTHTRYRKYLEDIKESLDVTIKQLSTLLLDTYGYIIE